MTNEETLTDKQREIRDAYRERFEKPDATYEEAKERYIGEIPEDQSLENYVIDWAYEEHGGPYGLEPDELNMYFDWKRYVEDTMEYDINVYDGKHAFRR